MFLWPSKDSVLRLVVGAFLIAASLSGFLAAQSLPSGVLEQLLDGASGLRMEVAETSVPLVGALSLGPIEIETPLVYVNPEAEYAWIGSSAMQGAIWTLDPAQLLLRIEVPGDARDEASRSTH